MLLRTQKQNAAEHRNLGALDASIPVLAYINSDDAVGLNWLENIFYVFNTFEGIDALLHKWFACSANMTLTLPTRDKVLIVNDSLPNELRSSLVQAMKLGFGA